MGKNLSTTQIDKQYLEQLVQRISKKLVDEFLKEVLTALTNAVIDLKDEVAKLAEGQKALQQEVAKLTKRVNVLAKALTKTIRALRRLAISHRRLVEEFGEFKRWIEDLFGRWSHYIGAGAEAMVRDVFRRIWESKKPFELDGIKLMPLRDLKPISKKRDGYQFDLSGIDDSGRVWLIEVKTRAISSDYIVDRMFKSVQRWVSDHPNTKFIYLVFALGGIERGLDSRLIKCIKSIGGEAIILDRFQSREILRQFGYPV